MKALIIIASVFLVGYAAQAALPSGYKIAADKMTKDSFGTETLSGHAELKHGAYKLTANAISINPEMGSIVASGNCQFEDGKTTMQSSQMIFKVENNTWKRVQ